MVKFWEITASRTSSSGQKEFYAAIPTRDFLGSYSGRWIDENFIKGLDKPLAAGETREFGGDWIIIGGATEDTVMNVNTWLSAQPKEETPYNPPANTVVAMPLRTQAEIDAEVSRQKAEQAVRQALLNAPIASSQILLQKWAEVQPDTIAGFNALTSAASSGYVAPATQQALTTIQQAGIEAYEKVTGEIISPTATTQKTGISTGLLIAGLIGLAILGGSS